MSRERCDADRGQAAGDIPPVAPVRRGLPWWKKLLFSMLVTSGFFVLLEVVLSLAGVRPLLYEHDPFVGFSSTIPLFVEQIEPDGRTTMVTAKNRLSLFNDQRFPREKPKNTIRIFCLGGSTTYGRPYDDTTSFAGWLRALLPAVDSSVDWEVINAGGISYASYRIALLMEELVEYQPDLFVVYSGHNEFLEHRTYADVLKTPRAVRELQSLLSRTRTYSTLRRWTQSGDDAARISGSDLLPAEVDTILDHSVGPESYTRDDVWKQHVLDHYEFSLRRMAVIAQSNGAAILFVTPASNLRDFTPFKSEHRAGLSDEQLNLWLGHLQRASDAFSAREFEEALHHLETARQIDDRHARQHFLRGRVLLHLDDAVAAKTAFEQARDEDICPLRALTEMRQRVLNVAADSDAIAVDFVPLLARRAEHGIPGDDWFLDHVHPTIEGNRILALAVMEKMHAAKLLRSPPRPDSEAIATATSQVLDSLDSRSHANALRNLAKVLGWAGRLQEAGKLAIRAVEGLPDDDNAHYLAGLGWKRLAQPENAKAEFEQALALNPQNLDARTALGRLLIECGEPAAACEQFEAAVEIDHASGWLQAELGFAYLACGRHQFAEEQFLLAALLQPALAEAYVGLAQVAEARNAHDEARQMFAKALEIDPGNQAARMGIERLDSSHPPPSEKTKSPAQESPNGAAREFAN